jgi:hypothetical protein
VPGHTTRPRRALGLSFAIRTDDGALTHHLDSVYGDLEETPERDVDVDLRHIDGEIAVTVEDRTYYRGTSRGVALANLAIAVNHEAVRATEHLVLVHAGGVEREGRAAIFPAAPAAGKSTLVAGLVQRGFRGLTDEVVALDPATGHVLAYPRPIALKRGSWAVLPTLRPQVEPDVEPYLTEQWLVPPSHIREGGIGRTCTPALVIVPRYDAGATTTCELLSRAEALEALASSCHNLDRWGRRGFIVLADVVRQSSCHRVTSGTLEGACDAVEALFEAGGGRS